MDRGKVWHRSPLPSKQYESLSARTAHTPRSSRHLFHHSLSWEQLRKARPTSKFFKSTHEKSKLWLPTDLIIGEIQSLRFAPGLETVSQAPFASRKRESEQQAEKALSPFSNNKVSFIAPTYTRGKPKPAEGRAAPP